MKQAVLMIILNALTAFSAQADMTGIDCSAPDGSHLGVDYTQNLVIGWGQAFSNGNWSAIVQKQNEVDGFKFEYHSGSWETYGSRHILVRKSPEGIIGRVRNISYVEECPPEQGFNCVDSKESKFTCQEVEVAPHLPPLPGPPVGYSVCDRTPAVKVYFEIFLNKRCTDISAIDLARVKTIDLSNLGLTSLKDGDFDGVGFKTDGGPNPESYLD